MSSASIPKTLQDGTRGRFVIILIDSPFLSPLLSPQRGRRVMKDRDGRPAQRDATFLAESGLVPKGLADSHLVTEVPADFSTTLCTTGLSQPGNPPEYYKRYAEFTRDINHPVKARVNGIWDREW